MPDDTTEPERIDAATTSDIPGTAEGSPIAGVEISEEDKAHAVKPDEQVMEVDGPPTKHP